jgi:hypothetical protein
MELLHTYPQSKKFLVADFFFFFFFFPFPPTKTQQNMQMGTRTLTEPLKKETHMKTTKMTTTNSLTATTSAWVCCLLELFSKKTAAAGIAQSFWCVQSMLERLL